MKKSTNLIIGILTTVVFFEIATLISRFISLDSGFIMPSFITHATMLALSLLAIIFLKNKKLINFPFKKVKLKYYIYGILMAVLVIVVSNILATVLVKVFGFQIDPSGKGLTVIANRSPLQIFLFIFLTASICEEFLFRGFTLNFFEPLKDYGVRINKNLFLSTPVILSGILFGMAHLVLLATETSGPMIFRILIFTTLLGTTAGYFQEKHKSILPAIIIHMAGNLPALIMSFL